MSVIFDYDISHSLGWPWITMLTLHQLHWDDQLYAVHWGSLEFPAWGNEIASGNFTFCEGIIGWRFILDQFGGSIGYSQPKDECIVHRDIIGIIGIINWDNVWWCVMGYNGNIPCGNLAFWKPWPILFI